MAEDKDQLVDEQTMETMSVAPPDPKKSDADADQGGSGVADRDPLSAHPS